MAGMPLALKWPWAAARSRSHRGRMVAGAGRGPVPGLGPPGRACQAFFEPGASLGRQRSQARPFAPIFSRRVLVGASVRVTSRISPGGAPSR